METTESTTTSFSYTFKTTKNPAEIFKFLRVIENWWTGIYNESITGKFEQLGDEFSFKAGEGMHYSRHQLVELIPNSKIAWLVTESQLSFLEDPNEWAKTKLEFNLEKIGDSTQVKFTHQGLVPAFECYNQCSQAWTNYLHNLEQKLNS